MLVVTHEMGFARGAANRVVFMDGGAIVESAEPAEFFGNPQTERAKDFLSKILTTNASAKGTRPMRSLSVRAAGAVRSLSHFRLRRQRAAVVMVRRQQVVIGTKFDQPGLGLKNPDGTMSGFDVDVAKSVANSSGTPRTSNGRNRRRVSGRR